MSRHRRDWRSAGLGMLSGLLVVLGGCNGDPVRVPARPAPPPPPGLPGFLAAVGLKHRTQTKTATASGPKRTLIGCMMFSSDRSAVQLKNRSGRADRAPGEWS